MGRRVHDSKRQLIIYLSSLELACGNRVHESLTFFREGEGETHECPFHTYISFALTGERKYGKDIEHS